MDNKNFILSLPLHSISKSYLLTIKPLLINYGKIQTYGTYR